MTRALWAWAAAAGMAAGVGCYSPAPYSPGYAYPAPGAYPAAPGGSYVVPGGAMPGGVPGSLGPAMTIPGSGPTLAAPINGSEGPVPTYEDPTEGHFDTPDDGFEQPTSDGGSPFMRDSAAPRRFNAEQASRPMDDVDYFAGLDKIGDAKVPSNLAGGTASVRPAGFELQPANEFGGDPGASQPGGDDGFGYDRAGYSWLQGVVDYDPDQKSWHIIYGLRPDPADRFGGSLTLADAGQMGECQDNDVVLVKGRIDQAAGRDLLGKPLYRVTSAELIGRYEQ